jgi:putative heme-binding domain-containing protein
VWRLRGLAALVDGLASRRETLDGVLSDPVLADDAEVRRSGAWVVSFAASLPGLLAGEGLDAEDRLAAIGLLGLLPPAEARPALVGVLRGRAGTAERLEAARVLSATFSDADVADDLLRAWDDAGPALRRGLAALLAARPDRADRLLDAVEAGSVAAGDLDLALVRSLIDNAPEPVKSRARSVLADRLPADRTEVLGRYRVAVDRPGDIDRGREVFGRVCATCHKVGDLGVAVGPDIGDTLGKSREVLLRDIIDPNAAIDANYVVYSAATRDGRVVSGLLAAESADALTLRQAEGRDETLRREEVEQLQATGLSLMPEGVENDVTPEQMADLLTFLKEHRYRDAGIPRAAASGPHP